MSELTFSEQVLARPESRISMNIFAYRLSREQISEGIAVLETRRSKLEDDIRSIIDADYTGQGSAQDYDTVIEAIQEELVEALAGEGVNTHAVGRHNELYHIDPNEQW